MRILWLLLLGAVLGRQCEKKSPEGSFKIQLLFNGENSGPEYDISSLAGQSEPLFVPNLLSLARKEGFYPEWQFRTLWTSDGEKTELSKKNRASSEGFRRYLLWR